jgi:hypothetical protein
MIFLVTVLLIEPQGLQGAWMRFAATQTGENFRKAVGLLREED